MVGVGEGWLFCDGISSIVTLCLFVFQVENWAEHMRVNVDGRSSGLYLQVLNHTCYIT